MVAGAVPSVPPWLLVLLSITTNPRSAGKVQTVLSQQVVNHLFYTKTGRTVCKISLEVGQQHGSHSQSGELPLLLNTEDINMGNSSS